MENFKFILLSIIVIMGLGLVGYWALHTLPSGGAYMSKQKQLALEEKNKTNGTIKDRIKDITLPKMQLSIFDAQSQTFEEIRLLLESTDINRLTPVEALLKLQEIKNKIQ